MNLFDLANGKNNDLLGSDIVDGIRLHKLEIFNWGTFDGFVWSFNPNGNTSLLTGESGSGKSTVVDALTTLLVSPRKIAYNKAADASARERTAKSYVLGYYGRKYAFEGKGKPEALRNQNSYSVILATFEDMLADKTVTLAVFFWFKDSDNTPSKFYVVSEKELFISKHFTKFNSNIRTLKDNLRKDGSMIFDDYKHYAECYRKLMNNVSEQAIDLFQQTISMKKVEALNDFVRGSMLEREDTATQIDELLKHYHNLNRAYEAVVKAKEQIEKLDPISIKGTEYNQKDSEKVQLEMARQSMEPWFAATKRSMISEKIADTKSELDEIINNISVVEQQEKRISKDIGRIMVEIKNNGGDEIDRLSAQLESSKTELTKKEKELSKYNKWSEELKLKPALSLKDYNDNFKDCSRLSTEYAEKKYQIQSEFTNTEIDIQKWTKEKEDTDKEIKSLRSRRSNIPSYLIDLRDEICSALKVSKERIPFAGEMLEVKEEDTKWEGAIERLAHSFAISLLVTEEYYSDVASWVNRHSLGAKLVYFRVGKKSRQNVFAQQKSSTVASKLMVKPDTVFTEWLTDEIEARFSHTCCEEIAEFKKESKAITITGQIKSNLRHEKDDRKKLDDRTKYVLGFSNKKKIIVLLELLHQYETRLEKLESDKSDIVKRQTKVESVIKASTSILEHDDFNSLNVSATTKAINDYNKRISELQNSNSILETLQKQLKELEEEGDLIKDKIKALHVKKGGTDSTLSHYQTVQRENEEKVQLETEADRAMYSFLANNFAVYAGHTKLTIENAAQLETKYNRGVTNKCEKLQEELSTLRSEIEKAMAKFRNEYPSESYEMSETVQSIKEYDELLRRLRYHNLPKYQDDFKKELQGKIINHISMFNGILSQYKTNITKRIREINDSLHTIDYNPGRYITIVCEDTPEEEIRIFRNQLKSCTEGMMTSEIDDELASRKFIQIKQIIERFKGRAECVGADRRWTEKVTDVRNWFIFSASERWRSDDEEYEHYSDSDGKSGGQKEKLAYTILAASLVYNYRLNQHGNNGSSFRLVVIDEAFLKSSDDSAKFGLKLFEQMNFQLLVVTPLLKISTIEPFISHVGFVAHSDITHKSTLKNISMEVYKQKRKEWEADEFDNMDQTK